MKVSYSLQGKETRNMSGMIKLTYHNRVAQIVILPCHLMQSDHSRLIYQVLPDLLLELKW
jgi:hypothetical protein